MTLKIMAWVFGITFVIIGILGFIPPLAPNNLLLGLFMVDTVHNIIHIVSGVLAMLAAYYTKYAQLYFKVLGVVYGIITILGFITHDLLIIHVNTADNFLHLAISAVAVYFGFFYDRASPNIHQPEERSDRLS